MGSHIDQVEVVLLGQPQRLLDVLDTQLRPIRANHANLASTNRFIDLMFLADNLPPPWGN